MLNYIHDHFTVNVTDEDIAAPNRGNWWDDPIRRAVMRQYKLSYPVEVRVGFGYADIFFPEETDKFDVEPYEAVSKYLQAYQNGWLLRPATFQFKLIKIVAKPPATDVTPKRYENRPPGVVKAGM